MCLILIIEADPAICDVLRMCLQAESYRVNEVDSIRHAEREVCAHPPDLLLLDMDWPNAGGLTAIKRIRACSPVPIIVLSTQTVESQILAALEAGADDYVSKPFSAAELIACVRATLQRSQRGPEPPRWLHLGDVTIDLQRRDARRNGATVHLSGLEYRILGCLSRQVGRIVRAEDLLREVWGAEGSSDTRDLRACIRALRQKLEPNASQPRFVVTELGVGYRLRLG
jgi:two-component system KDP operon response regulator KdpE